MLMSHAPLHAFVYVAYECLQVDVLHKNGFGQSSLSEAFRSGNTEVRLILYMTKKNSIKRNMHTDHAAISWLYFNYYFLL
jgi:hypothetical protein